MLNPQIGDVVQLNSGGVSMTVIDVIITARWYDEESNCYEEENFDSRTLKIVTINKEEN